MMNRIGVALSLLLAAAATAQAPDLAAMDIVERSVPAGPVAMVNGQPVSREDFLGLYRQQRSALKMMRSGGHVEDGDRVRTGVRCLSELLQRELLLQEAAKQNLSVAQADLDAAYRTEIKNMQDAAADAGQSLSEDAVLTRTGMPEAEFRNALREAMLLEKMRDRIAKNAGITISGKEIKEFYDDNPRFFARPGGVHIKQIFAFPRPEARNATEEAWTKAKEKIDKALARIRAGETFDVVGKDLSESASGTPKVDLGLVPAEQLPPFYREAIATMKPNEISSPIRSEHGYHLIQFISAEDKGNISLDQAEERIRSMLSKAKNEEAVDAYCQPILSNDAHVLVFLDLEKNLAGLDLKKEVSGAS